MRIGLAWICLTLLTNGNGRIIKVLGRVPGTEVGQSFPYPPSRELLRIKSANHENVGTIKRTHEESNSPLKSDFKGSDADKDGSNGPSRMNGDDPEPGIETKSFPYLTHWESFRIKPLSGKNLESKPPFGKFQSYHKHTPDTVNSEFLRSNSTKPGSEDVSFMCSDLSPNSEPYPPPSAHESDPNGFETLTTEPLSYNVITVKCVHDPPPCPPPLPLLPSKQEFTPLLSFTHSAIFNKILSLQNQEEYTLPPVKQPFPNPCKLEIKNSSVSLPSKSEIKDGAPVPSTAAPYPQPGPTLSPLEEYLPPVLTQSVNKSPLLNELTEYGSPFLGTATKYPPLSPTMTRQDDLRSPVKVTMATKAPQNAFQTFSSYLLTPKSQIKNDALSPSTPAPFPPPAPTLSPEEESIPQIAILSIKKTEYYPPVPVIGAPTTAKYELQSPVKVTATVTPFINPNSSPPNYPTEYSPPVLPTTAPYPPLPPTLSSEEEFRSPLVNLSINSINSIPLHSNVSQLSPLLSSLPLQEIQPTALMPSINPVLISSTEYSQPVLSTAPLFPPLPPTLSPAEEFFPPIVISSTNQGSITKNPPTEYGLLHSLLIPCPLSQWILSLQEELRPIPTPHQKNPNTDKTKIPTVDVPFPLGSPTELIPTTP